MTDQNNVLIVEDDRAVGRTYQRMLSRSSCRVETATSLSEARAFLSRCNFDVVLLDLKLGNETGFGLIPFLQGLRPRPTVAVISGNLTAANVVDLFGQCAAVVPKPVECDALVKLVEALVKTRPPERRADGFYAIHALSSREAEVLDAATDGLQNKEIATRIDCKVSTVVTYWKRIFEKTGCHTRGEVLGLLLRRNNRS